MKVIIIGNAPVKQEFGCLVDEFEYIIRINKFESGHQKHTGSKTNILAIGGLNPIGSYIGTIWGMFPAHSYDELFKQAKKKYGANLVKFDKDHIKMLQTHLKYPFHSVFSTTGLTTIYMALKVFHSPIYTLGFELDGNKDYENIFGEKCKLKKLEYHNLLKERKYYDWLIQKGDVIELRNIV